MHPFFEEIKTYPDLVRKIRFDLTTLPNAYIGKHKIKAILLGADPTNNGIKSDQGLKKIKTVFGIDSEYEDFFFGSQKRNLKLLDITMDNLFIQNVCRNYFIEETEKNKEWNKIAEIWIKYLKAEIIEYHKLPILVTAEKVMRAITHNSYKATYLYTHPERYLPIWSESLRTDVYPMYRNPKYNLSKQTDYKNFLRKKLN